MLDKLAINGLGRFPLVTRLRSPSMRRSLAAVLLEGALSLVLFFLCSAASDRSSSAAAALSYRLPSRWLSIMEALAAVSLAGNVLQFVDYTAKIVGQAKKYHNSTHGMLQRHIEIDNSIDDLDTLLQKLRYTPLFPGSDAKVDPDIDPALMRKAERCTAIADDLRAALFKVKVQGAKNWRKSVRKAFRSVMSEEYIESLQQQLSTVQQDLQLHLSIEQREQLKNVQAGQSDLLSRLDSVALSIYQNAVSGQEDLLNVQQKFISQGFHNLEQQNINLSAKIDSLKSTLPETSTHLVLSPALTPLPSPAPTGRDLYKAIRDGRTDMVPDMIQQGANFNYVSDKDENRPIHLAVKQKDTDIVDLLLRSGADAECYNGQGLTPLMMAARYGALNIAVRLIEAGCNIDSKLVACRAGPTSGIDLDNTTTWDSTALTLASQNGHAPVVRELLSRGASVDPLSNHRFTPLHAAVQNGHPSCTEALLDAGANIEAVTDQGFTALIYAANVNQIECARILLDHGANTDAKKSHGMTAILEAIWTRNAAMVDLLAGGGADLEITTGICGDRHTPLQMAAEWGAADIVAILLKHGADRGHTLSNGMTAEQSARKRCDKDVIEVFERFR